MVFSSKQQLKKAICIPIRQQQRWATAFRWWSSLGRIVGKALYEGILLEYNFAPLFVSKLVGRYAFLDELSSLDVELYRNLMYLKHYEGTHQSSHWTSQSQRSTGEHSIVELRPGGSHIAVTNENKLQYIHAVADYKLNRQMQQWWRRSSGASRT
ncbi:hypothetical protein CLOM_g21692 [Closterium sp. NIES-68]|nr:hypothetical protein CLOM_g21692 [Closterium sp. NIES-68]